MLLGQAQQTPEATATILPTTYGAAAQDFGLHLVPKVRARLCAGTGSLETSKDIKAYYAFREDWLLSKSRSLSRLVLMDVFGDSMEPEIQDGDTVLVDEGQRDVLAGRIYAVGLDDEVVVKCLDKLPGKLLLRSINERYAPIEVDLSREHSNIRIVGRVLWWCREAS